MKRKKNLVEQKENLLMDSIIDFQDFFVFFLRPNKTSVHQLAETKTKL